MGKDMSLAILLLELAVHLKLRARMATHFICQCVAVTFFQEVQLWTELTLTRVLLLVHDVDWVPSLQISLTLAHAAVVRWCLLGSRKLQRFRLID